MGIEGYGNNWSTLANGFPKREITPSFDGADATSQLALALSFAVQLGYDGGGEGGLLALRDQVESEHEVEVFFAVPTLDF